MKSRSASPLVTLPSELLEEIMNYVILPGTPWEEARLTHLTYRCIHPRITSLVDKLVFKRPIIDAHHIASDAFLHFMFLMRHYQYASLVEVLTLHSHGDPNHGRTRLSVGGKSTLEQKNNHTDARNMTDRKHKQVEALLYLCTRIHTLLFACDAKQSLDDATLPMDLAIKSLTLNEIAAYYYLPLFTTSSLRYHEIHLLQPSGPSQYIGSMFKQKIYERLLHDIDPEPVVVDYLFIHGANMKGYCKLLSEVYLEPIHLVLTVTTRFSSHPQTLVGEYLGRSLADLVMMISKPRFHASLKMLSIKNTSCLSPHVMKLLTDELGAVLHGRETRIIADVASITVLDDDGKEDRLVEKGFGEKLATLRKEALAGEADAGLSASEKSTLNLKRQMQKAKEFVRMHGHGRGI